VVLTLEGSAADMEHTQECLTKELIYHCLQSDDARIVLVAIALEKIISGALH
jgi:hypothetical protein